jgi:hypothetical protein
MTAGDIHDRAPPSPPTSTRGVRAETRILEHHVAYTVISEATSIEFGIALARDWDYGDVGNGDITLSIHSVPCILFRITQRRTASIRSPAEVPLFNN